MAAELELPSHNLADVIDRVLDKGVVIDAYVRIMVVGIDLITVDARVVVAGIETYLTYGPILADQWLTYRSP